MNKKNTRKGFTIVELVIVIVVIAILAAVLIPTFGNMISKANESKAMQEARNIFTDYMINNAQNGAVDGIVVIEEGKYVYAIDDGNFEVDANGNLNNYKTYAEAQKAVDAPENVDRTWGEATAKKVTVPTDTEKQ